jgi:Domain of unknown function (DUF4381)
VQPTASLSPLPRVEGLNDIVLAAPAGFFPLAPGWYVLALLLAALAAWAFLRYRRHRAANLYRRQALAELEALVDVLEHKGGRYEVAARLPELLKRVALQVAPRAEVAFLTGADWLAQLDRMYGGDAFSKGPGRLLPRLAYGTATFVASVPRAELDALVRLSREWVQRHHPVPVPPARGAPDAKPPRRV